MHRWSFLVEGCLVVTYVIIYLASLLPRGVSQGQLTSASGTSAAHFGDGCRGYRPGALCASIIGGMCGGGVTSQRGFLREQLSHGAEVATSGTASRAVTVLNLTGSVWLHLELQIQPNPHCCFKRASLDLMFCKSSPSSFEIWAFYCHIIKCILRSAHISGKFLSRTYRKLPEEGVMQGNK